MTILGLNTKELDPSQFNIVFQARQDFEKAKDEGAMRDVVARVYRALGCGEAPPIYVFDSPLAAMLAIPHLAAAHGITHDQYPYHLLKSIQNPLRSLLGNPDGRAMERIGTLRIGEQLTDPLRRPVKDQLTPKFLDTFTDRLCGILRDVGGDALVAARMKHGLFGSIHESTLDWWSGVCTTPAWWWLYSKFGVVSRKPSFVEMVDSRRLHREDGPAVQFADGFDIWMWRGVPVPSRFVLHPETITVKEVLDEANAEFRRIMILRMGPGRYLSETGAQVVDMDSLTLLGSAPRALMEDLFGNKWLVGTDGSTARVYTMAVPREARTCREAHAMIAGFDESRLIAEA